MNKWTEEEMFNLRKGYEEGKTPTELSSVIKRSPHSIRNKAYEINITSNPQWTDEEIKKLKKHYRNNKLKGELKLDEFASEIGRSKTNICRKARRLGLTNKKRKCTFELAETMKENKKGIKFWSSAGEKDYHWDYWLKLNYIERDKSIEEIAKEQGVNKETISTWLRKWGLVKEKIGKFGYSNLKKGSGFHTGVSKIMFACQRCGKEFEKWPSHVTGDNVFCSSSCAASYRVYNNKGSVYSDARGGKRKDLDGQYFRSAWEANYARYLNYIGEKWEYEPIEFEFKEIKRGTRFYTPDFYLPDSDKFIEIKGWFRKKDKTKLKRLKKYYPEQFKKLILVIEDAFKGEQAKFAHKIGIEKIESYKEIENKLGGLIENWEYKKKS